MRYLKYFEGFTNDELNNIINSKKTSVFKINRNIENKNNKLSDDLINYDIHNFKSKFEHGNYLIYPDNNFIDLYRDYCKDNSLEFNDDVKFSIDILPEYPLGGYNYIDVYNLLPPNLKGLSIGYKLYKFILNRIDFIMTDKDNLPEAKNLWYNLLQDKDVYSGTNQYYNIIIKKDIDDNKLKSIINKIKDFNLIYDNELNSKIKELYG